MSGGEYLVLVAHEPGAMARLGPRTDGVTRLEPVAFEGRARVFAQTGCVHAAASRARHAVLLGSVFERHGSNDHSIELKGSVLELWLQGSTDALLDRHWGGYVAVGSTGSAVRILRDPSGAMPCYYAATPGGVILGSSIMVLLEAGFERPAVEIDRVAQGLYRADLPGEATALSGIRELLPGDELVIDARSVDTLHRWSPWDHVAFEPDLGFAGHASVLRRAVQNTVAAWSRRFERVLVGVSGGLDSSIVATCLQRPKPPVVGVTVATDDPIGDERDYARTICGHLGLELVEEKYESCDFGIARCARPNLPRPTGRTIAQVYDAAIMRALRYSGAQAFFTGNGGDNVFAFSHSAGALADRLLHDGISSGALATNRAIRQLTGCTAIEAWQSALRLLRRPRRYQWRADRRMLASEVVAELDAQPLRHPWLDAPAGALPGKAAHIASLLRIQRHLDGTRQLGMASLVNPLMSQPIVETSLAVPSWMWCQAGQDRSVARHAFADALPRSIVERRSKGGPDGFVARMLMQHRSAITECLLDGSLARHGIIDRPALERRLRSDRPDWGAERVRLFELLEAEAWIDHWRAG